MPQFIEVELTLDSFDLVMLVNLIKVRRTELEALKAENPAGVVAELCDEQLAQYAGVETKLEQARAQVREIKEQADAAFFASLKK